MIIDAVRMFAEHNNLTKWDVIDDIIVFIVGDDMYKMKVPKGVCDAQVYHNLDLFFSRLV